jgi:outer membrane PBP1 activator LpoA protein
MLPNIGTNAATGTLFIDPQNHIYRQLLWARFNQGKAQLMS